MSQKILFNRENPFEGSDGFAHFFNRNAQLNAVQHNSQAYRHFSHQLRSFMASSHDEVDATYQKVQEKEEDG